MCQSALVHKHRHYTDSLCQWLRSVLRSSPSDQLFATVTHLQKLITFIIKSDSVQNMCSAMNSNGRTAAGSAPWTAPQLSQGC